jgi:hypothetical protein
MNRQGISNHQGFSDRSKYEECETKRSIKESTAPGEYQLFGGKFENCDKCKVDRNYRPFDLVDVESELKNITRRASRCPENKYDPRCKKSSRCLSTYDASRPVVLAPEVCPIVYNNIPRQTHPGFTDPVFFSCSD